MRIPPKKIAILNKKLPKTQKRTKIQGTKKKDDNFLRLVCLLSAPFKKYYNQFPLLWGPILV
jgi:hypothetical protein